MSISGREVREWIMFLVAIFVVIYFAISDVELDAWWLMLLGSMLGLSVLVTGVHAALGARRQPPEEDDQP